MSDVAESFYELTRKLFGTPENVAAGLRDIETARHRRSEIQNGSACIKFRNSVLKGSEHEMGVKMGTDSQRAADSRTGRNHRPLARHRRLAAQLDARATDRSGRKYRDRTARGLAAQQALSLVSRSAADTASLHSHTAVENGGNPRKVIVIGFMGGFAKSDDPKHPEVQFAQYLQQHYRSDIHAAVFGNHHGRKALQEVRRFLDVDGDGSLSPDEKENARIIIYGHSWGATETVVFARELGKKGIPVLLTVQVDSIAKPGRDNSKIPANVAKAINFYQSGGPLHGRAEIFAADPAQTKIIGNLHMTYEGHTIDCDNYPWYARTFNKPHHEIENDQRVWTLAESLIDSEFAGANPASRE